MPLISHHEGCAKSKYIPRFPRQGEVSMLNRRIWFVAVVAVLLMSSLAGCAMGDVAALLHFCYLNSIFLFMFCFFFASFFILILIEIKA